MLPFAQGGVKCNVVLTATRPETPDIETALGAHVDVSTRPSTCLSKQTEVEHEDSVGGGDGGEIAGKTTREVNPQFEKPLPEAPKLVNPATRGRKAALKSHAAGQVPQPVLPPDIGVQSVQIAPRKENRDDGSAAPGTGRDAPKPKIKMKLPGFISARGGGPWSREAHDLLERGRPHELEDH